MSQKEGKFQSKARPAGGKKPGGFGGKGKPRSGGFGKRFEGDKGERRSFGDKPKRSFGGPKRFDRDAGGESNFKRKPRFEHGAPRGDSPSDAPRPYKKREFGDRDQKRSFGGDRPRGERSYKPREDRDFKPRGDRPYKPREGGDFKPRENREYKPREDREFKPRGDRPYKSREGSDFKPRGDRPYKPREDRDFKPRGEREYKPRGDFKPREDREFKPRGDRPYKPREDRDFKPRGERAFKPREDREFKPREDRDTRGGGDSGRKRSNRFETPKPFRRDDDRKRFDKKPSPSFDETTDFANVEATPETRSRLKSERAGLGSPSSAFLYGVHAVREALKNPKRLHQRLICSERGLASVQETIDAALAEGLNMPQIVMAEKEDIERLLPRDAVHQDLLLDCQPLEEIFLQDILVGADDNAKILILDQVTDPHNVGAIMRSAAAFGALAVVAQKLHAPDVTGTLAKSASGAVEHVPLVKEVNLSRSLEILKEAGFFCIGLAEEGKRTLAEMKLSGKVALVLGAEGDGLRRLVAQNCDELAKLPTQGDIGSLNVSNAAAVALYELKRA